MLAWRKTAEDGTELGPTLETVLVDEGLVSEADVSAAMAEADENGVFFGHILVRDGKLKEREFIACLVKNRKIPYLSLVDYDINESLVELVSEETCKKYFLLPVDKMGKILTVAMVNPLDDLALQTVREACPDLRIKPILCDWRHYREVCERHFGSAGKSSDSSGISMESLGLSGSSSASSRKKKPAAAPEPETNDLPDLSLDAAGDESPAPSAVEAELQLLREVANSASRAAETALGAMQQVRATQAPDAGALNALRMEQRKRLNSVHSFNDPVSDPESDTAVQSALMTRRPPTRHNFDNFRVCPASEFSVNVCKAIALRPGESCNPCYVYGPSGSGKTHLIASVGHALPKHHPELRAGYVSCGRFIDRFNAARWEGAADLFREAFAGWDVLMFDDAQLLAGQPEAQDEFFHVFSAITNAGRQMLIAADRPIGQIAGLDPRLISRLESGTVIAVEPPDEATRLIILGDHVPPGGPHVPEEVRAMIASRETRDVRVMVGQLRKIIAFAEMVGQDITTEIAAQVLELTSSPRPAG